MCPGPLSPLFLWALVFPPYPSNLFQATRGSLWPIAELHSALPASAGMQAAPRYPGWASLPADLLELCFSKCCALVHEEQVGGLLSTASAAGLLASLSPCRHWRAAALQVRAGASNCVALRSLHICRTCLCTVQTLAHPLFAGALPPAPGNMGAMQPPTAAAGQVQRAGAARNARDTFRCTDTYGIS